MRIHHATQAKANKFKIALIVEDNEIVATDARGNRLAAGPQGNKVLEDAITKATGKPAKGKGKANGHATVADPYEALAKDEGWRKTRWGFSKEGEDSVKADNWRALCEDQGLELEDAGDMGDVNDDSDADQGKSIVKAKYKTLYKPHKDKSGDELSFKINEHVTREDDETGEVRVDKDALRRFAQANGCWVPSYGSLVSRTGSWNAGMARMNVANRLRAKIRQAQKAKEKFEINWA